MSLPSPVIIDTAGPELTVDDVRRLKHPLTGGIILFGRHWTDRARLAAMLADVRAIREDLLVCVDHEGGRVQRFRTDGYTVLPPMRRYGELWMTDPMRALDAVTAAGFVLASELRACGVDLSFAPVLDLDHGPSGVIGDRAFHRDPRVATLLAKGLMHGMLMAGMAHCGKHFPGHGHVSGDSHFDVPVDRRTLKAILDDDALPYRWLGSTLRAVMPAHVIYSRVDKRPAGFSARWLQDILRGRLGYDGAIFSDDLSMAGARVIEGKAVSYLDASQAALDAGCDLLLLCNRSPVDGGADIDAVLDGLWDRAQRGTWHASAAIEARRQALRPVGPAIAWDDLMRRHDYIRALESCTI